MRWVPAALYQRFWFDTIAGFALDVDESVPELRVGDALAAQDITGRKAQGGQTVVGRITVTNTLSESVLAVSGVK